MGRGGLLHAFFTVSKMSLSTAVNFIDVPTVETLVNSESFDHLFELQRIANSPLQCFQKKFTAYEVNFAKLSDLLKQLGESRGTKRSISQSSTHGAKLKKTVGRVSTTKIPNELNLKKIFCYMKQICSSIRLMKVALIIDQFLPLMVW